MLDGVRTIVLKKENQTALSKGKPLECSSRSLVVLSIEKGDDKIEHC